MEFFATDDVDTYHLFGGTDYWISVKRELNASEARTITYAGLKRASRKDADSDDVSLDLDLEAAAFTKTAMWLVDWNVPGPDKKTVDITTSMKAKKDALKNLTSAAFAEIERVIDAHVASRVDEKKVPPALSGPSAPSAT